MYLFLKSYIDFSLDYVLKRNKITSVLIDQAFHQKVPTTAQIPASEAFLSLAFSPIMIFTHYVYNSANNVSLSKFLKPF